MALSDVIKTTLDQIQYIAKTETIIGEPLKAGEVTLIPVSKVSVGFAAGGAGKDEKYGNGTGGGVNVIPIAFVSVCGDHVQIHPVDQSEPNLSDVFTMLPDIVKKISKFAGKKDESGKDGDTDTKE
ncbi:MAG: spore germination protein GerW family protein [Fibrobacter sp.]|nr:spore germination protein GerW family protein [Fibrobacter sp.]